MPGIIHDLGKSIANKGFLAFGKKPWRKTFFRYVQENGFSARKIFQIRVEKCFRVSKKYVQ